MNSKVAAIAIGFSFVLSVYWTFTNKIVPTVKSALAQSTAMKSAKERDVHIVVKVNGEVLLDRDEETEFQRVYLGTRLYYGDLLQVEEGAEVTVRCADLTEWNVPSGTESGVSRGCPKKSSPVLVNGLERSNARNYVSLSNEFHIISPRKGMRLFNNKVRIRWKPIYEATRYTVQVGTGQKIIWKKEVEISKGEDLVEVLFEPEPDNVLQEVTDYFIKVKAHRENSSPIEVKEVFNLLKRDIANKLSADEEKIKEMNFDPNEEEILLAYLYYFYSHQSKIIIAEAIERLESLKQSDSSSVIFDQLLGNLYEQVELHYKAKNCYLRAKELCEKLDDTQCTNKFQQKLERLNQLEKNQ